MTETSPSGSRVFRRVLAFFLTVALIWCVWVYVQIEKVGKGDEARGADAIAVFGAAHYNLRPSPVFHARLDHAVTLYRRKIAPYVVVLGGSGDPTDTFSEATVGRNYLLANGVPYENILVETRSIDTEQQAALLAQIASQNHFHVVVVVSDATHLFRIRELCRAQGLNVLTSPRPQFGRISTWSAFTRVMHEIAGYTVMRLHLRTDWLRRWIEGRDENA